MLMLVFLLSFLLTILFSNVIFDSSNGHFLLLAFLGICLFLILCRFHPDVIIIIIIFKKLLISRSCNLVIVVYLLFPFLMLIFNFDKLLLNLIVLQSAQICDINVEF